MTALNSKPGAGDPKEVFNFFLVIPAIYVLTQPLHHEQDVTQGQFLSRVQLVGIQSFPSPRPVTILRLKIWFLCLMVYQLSWVI